jgi:SulP family sulfate permease
MAQSVTLEEEPLTVHPHTDEEHSLLDAHIVAYRLDGPLFFGGAHQALLELSTLSDIRVVILRMSRMASLDATGAAVLRDTVRALEHRGITVLLSGVRDEHLATLRALGVLDSLADQRHLFTSTPAAIDHARKHAAGGHASDPPPTERVAVGQPDRD